MYNTNVACVYTDLSTYQEVLLRILDTDMEGMVEQLQLLYEQLETNESIQTILKKIKGWTSPDMAFCVLFSYDYLEHTHRLIGEILNNRPLTSYDALYSLV